METLQIGDTFQVQTKHSIQTWIVQGPGNLKLTRTRRLPNSPLKVTRVYQEGLRICDMADEHLQSAYEYQLKVAKLQAKQVELFLARAETAKGDVVHRQGLLADLLKEIKRRGLHDE